MGLGSGAYGAPPALPDAPEDAHSAGTRDALLARPVVIGMQNPGFVSCTVGGDPQTFSGVDIDVLTSVLGWIGWRQVREHACFSTWQHP